MSGQLHITHRGDYLRGRQDGRADALADRDYRPGSGWPRSSDDADGQRAYGLGYEAGFSEGYPCTNGTCDHIAHQ